MWTLLGWLREIPESERKAARSEAQRRFLAARDALQGWITPRQRARLTSAYGRMLWNNRSERYGVLQQIIESVGYTALASDGAVIDMLDAYREL